MVYTIIFLTLTFLSFLSSIIFTVLYEKATTWKTEQLFDTIFKVSISLMFIFLILSAFRV